MTSQSSKPARGRITFRTREHRRSALMKVPGISLDDVAICCDLERHVFYAAHTDPKVGEALRATHWFEVAEWTSSGPGKAASNL